MEGAGIRGRVDSGRDVPVRPGARTARVLRETGQRVERRRRSPFAPAIDARTDRRAGRVLFSRSEFRVRNIATQKELIDAQTIRERLLAIFFASVALLLAGIGLYGVLNYSVVQRRREIGIRLAIGAPAGAIARLVTVDVSAMVVAGSLAGLGLGMASVRTIETLFYQLKATDVGMLMRRRWPFSVRLWWPRCRQ